MMTIAVWGNCPFCHTPIMHRQVVPVIMSEPPLFETRSYLNEDRTLLNKAFILRWTTKNGTQKAVVGNLAIQNDRALLERAWTEYYAQSLLAFLRADPMLNAALEQDPQGTMAIVKDALLQMPSIKRGRKADVDA